jgi:hypothetical protein
MNQVLNIFRKDTHRFWPEILVSVVITLAFAFSYPNQWKVFHDQNVQQSMLQITGALGFLMVTGWWLLIARVVHEETLVGDRQFWITRPYEWKKLLAAKVLFAAAWIGVPYLLAQSLVRAEAGFSAVPNGPVLLLNLLMMSTAFLLPLFSIATVTQNFARLTLTLLACLALLVGFAFATNGIPHGYISSNPYSNWILYPLLFCGCAVAITLQYATRRVWVSRALLIVLPFLLALTVAANRRQSLVDRAYPQPGTTSAAPVSIAAVPSAVHPFEARSYEGQDYIDFPIQFSGVAEGYAVAAADFKFTLTAADGSQWTSPWQETRDRIGPGGSGGWLSLQLNPALYDRFKSGPVNLHITFAIDRYQADSVTTMPFPTRDQAVPGVGICTAQSGFMDGLVCRSAHDPRFTYAAVVFSKGACSNSSAPPAATKPGAAWYEPGNIDFALSSVWTPHLYFSGGGDDDNGSRYRWRVCPGSPLTVTQYHLVERTQAGFTLTNFVLPAYVQPT